MRKSHIIIANLRTGQYGKRDASRIVCEKGHFLDAGWIAFVFKQKVIGLVDDTMPDLLPHNS
jgi:hypothetical protein